MAKISKRRKEFLGKYDLTKPFALNEALDAVKACANAKFDESVDVAIQLGIDPRKSDQAGRHGQDRSRGCVHAGCQC